MAFNEIVNNILGYVSQPDSRTCQAASVAKCIGEKDVFKVRSELDKLGQAGSPYVMGEYLKPRVRSYSFLPQACLLDAINALNEGATCIVHGWFTNSGHVICLVKTELDPSTLSTNFICDDPWYEFNFPRWTYSPHLKSGNDVHYSALGIYAACVVGTSAQHASQIYKKKYVDYAQQGMWLHIVHN